MPRYFDLSNPTFRSQALAILMLVLLVIALAAARGSMAFRQALRGPWYKSLLPQGARSVKPSISALIPSDAASYTWVPHGHHRISLSFFDAGRASVAGRSSAKIRASAFIQHLFPASHGWAAPQPSIEDILGVPMLIWRSYRVGVKTPAIVQGRLPIEGVRLLIARAAGNGRFHVVIFGLRHGLSIYDKELFLKIVTGLAHRYQ